MGPWTVQATLSADEGGIRDLGLERAAAREADGSNSRYEEPEAVGINPVFKTVRFTVSAVNLKLDRSSYRFSVVQRVGAGAGRGLWRLWWILGEKHRLGAWYHLVDH